MPTLRVDARVAANAWLGARAGTAEECARRLEAAGRLETPTAAVGPSRGAARMDAVRRIVGALLRLPAPPPRAA